MTSLTSPHWLWEMESYPHFAAKRTEAGGTQHHRARKQQDQDSKNDWLQNDILESYYLCKSLTLYRALNVPGSHLMHKLLRISKTVRAVWGLSEHSSLNNCTHCTPIKLVLSRGSGWKHVCFVLELGIKSGTWQTFRLLANWTKQCNKYSSTTTYQAMF